MGRWHEPQILHLLGQVRNTCAFTTSSEQQRARDILVELGRLTTLAVVDIFDARTEMCHQLCQYAATHTTADGVPLPPTPQHVTSQIEINLKYHIESREPLKAISKDLESLAPTQEQVAECFILLTTPKPTPRKARKGRPFRVPNRSTPNGTSTT